MNEFRDKLLSGKALTEPLLKPKPSRDGEARSREEESFSDLTIPRDEARLANHREGDRHRLESETVHVAHRGKVQPATLINLSGGGAMIEGAEGLRLWDRVELRLDGSNSVEAAVRWVRGERIGLEFAHETRIDLNSEDLADTLREVLKRSFADVALAASEEPESAETLADDNSEDGDEAAEGLRPERELRHPLIWGAEVHYSHDTTPVRLRNISAGGALIEGASGLKVDAELLLDLDEAGAIFATVTWARGDTVGLKFHSPFDLKKLAAVRPEVAGPRWIAPDYLRDDRSANSPWARQWGRSDLAGLQRSLDARS